MGHLPPGNRARSRYRARLLPGGRLTADFFRVTL
jgi:hypothetical protein